MKTEHDLNDRKTKIKRWNGYQNFCLIKHLAFFFKGKCQNLFDKKFIL